MKQLIILLVISIGLFSCTAPSDNLEKENLEIVKKYMNAVETNDVEAMSALLADDYKGYGPSVNDSTTKEEAINNWKQNIANLYESVKYSRYQNVAIKVPEGEEAKPGQWVSNWAQVTIKYKDGRGPVEVWLNAVYKLENGKITLSRTAYNEADVLRQLGYEFIPPAK
jgi:limonene-1,2-epoxide hydrolase